MKAYKTPRIEKFAALSREAKAKWVVTNADGSQNIRNTIEVEMPWEWGLQHIS